MDDNQNNSNMPLGASEGKDADTHERLLSDSDFNSEASVFSSFMKKQNDSDKPSLFSGLQGSKIASAENGGGNRLFSSYLNSDEEIEVASAAQTNTEEVPPIVSPASTDDLLAPVDDATLETSTSQETTTEVTNPTPAVEEAPISADPFASASKDTEDFSEELTDSAFPLFLSFKANDNISSVTEAIREKSQKGTAKPFTAPSNHFEEVSESVSSESETAATDEFGEISSDHRMLNRPIFKPAPVSSDSTMPSEPSLNIPDVFSSKSSIESESVPIPAAVTEDKHIEPVFFTDEDKPVFVPFRPAETENSKKETVNASSAPVKSSENSYDIPLVSHVPASSNDVKDETIPVFTPLKMPDRSSTKETKDSVSAKDKLNERPGSKDRLNERHNASEKTLERPGGHDQKRAASAASVKSPSASIPVEAPAPLITSPISALSASTDRISNSRYTAAQQMGTFAPLPSRDIKGSKKKGSHSPILFALFGVAFVVGMFALWTFFDFGTVLFGRNTEASLSETTVMSSSTVSESAVVSSEQTTLATSATSSESATVTTSKETTAATTKETTKETTVATTKETTAATTAATTKETTKETTAATTKETTAATTSKAGGSTSAMIPSGFSTTISDGKSSGDSASFNINFKNMGSTDVSLLDGVKQITVTFTTGGAVIDSVTSADFVFTLKEGKTNVFIGIPISTDVIARKDTKAVNISATSKDGTSIGKYSIKYYVECYS